MARADAGGLDAGATEGVEEEGPSTVSIEAMYLTKYITNLHQAHVQ